jgi:GR25 family glycosyltransferase involved in LPS biosynthesis
MITKIITLPSATDRQNRIKKAFEEKSIKFDFVDGVMVNDIKFSRNKCGFIFNDTFYPINKNQLLQYTNRLWVRFGEIANLFAHYKLYKQLLNDNTANEYLICEDDCKPSLNFTIDRIKNFDYSKLDVLYLQSITAHYQNKQPLINSLSFYEKYPKVKIINQFVSIICEGTASYIITKSGAKKFCDYIDNNGYDGPVDNVLARIPNMILSCPPDIENYFFLEDTAKFSYTHQGNFSYNYDLSDIKLQSNIALEFID